MSGEIELLPPVAFDFMHNDYRYAGTYQMNIKHDFAKISYTVHCSRVENLPPEIWATPCVVQWNREFFSKMFHNET
jgi:hypothetical protein